MPSLIKDRSGVYYIVFSNKGKRIWRSTRTKDKETAYKTFLLLTKPKAENRGKSLREAIKEYLDHVQTNFSPKTYGVYKVVFKHFEEFLGDIPVESITPKHLDLYKIERARKVKPASVNIEIRGCRAFFNCLKRWEIVQKNPCDGVSQLKITDGIPAYLTLEQLESLMSNLHDQWLKNIIGFAAMTGVRLGELLNIRWEDINLENKTVIIRSSEAYRVKGGKMRVIPLNHSAITTLERMTQHEGLVFTGRRGGRANPNYVSSTFRRFIRGQGMDKKLHFHSLRHGFASLLVKNGVSLYQVQKLLGHSSSRITEIYAHLQNSELHSVVDQITF
jgi:integrase